MCWLVGTSKDLGGRPPLASRCISLTWLFFHGDATDEKDPSRIRTLSAKARCVLFVSFAVRCGSISPTFPTLLEAVHAGLLIVKLLSRLQLSIVQPHRDTRSEER